MATISQNVNFEILEKLPDGTYKRKYPKTRADDGTTFDEHLAESASQTDGVHGIRVNETSGHIEYYDGKWKSGGNQTYLSSTQPTSPKSGDTWYKIL